MKGSNDDGTPSMDPIKAFFGPPPPRRPIPSHSFNIIVKIFSLFSGQNPFSDHASNAEFTESPRLYGGNQNNPKRPNSGDDSMSERGENEASGELIVPASVEVCNFSLQSEASNGVAVEDFSINGSFNGLDMIMDESCQTTNNTKTTDKIASEEGGQDAQMVDVQKIPETLSGIERMIMDDFDDMGLLALTEKDVSSTFLNDFGLIWDTDVIDNTVAAENCQTRNLASEGNVKEDVEAEVKRKDAELRSITGGHMPESQVELPMNREISSQEETKNQHTGTCLEYNHDKDKNFCKEKDTNKLMESEGLTFTTQKSKNVGVRSFVDFADKGSKSDIANRGETIMDKNASLKVVKTGKHKHKSGNGKSHNSTRLGGADQLFHAKVVKTSANKVKKSQPESSKGICYTRTRLMRLRNVTSVSEDIVEAIKEIEADLFGNGQNSAAEGTRDTSGANKEIEGSPTESKLAKDLSIEKNKKRGPLTEARKEKKKWQKRKKRAEMNKKLGVRRLKLRPDLKPKVVPPCRHYLLGRCQQGEICKFSHDLIPLTKSKPCCHFARNACMKGNDCPFDHQLSKYPCKNVVDTGFCIRGDSCSFSHKMSAAEGSKTDSVVCKSDPNSLPKLDELNSKHQRNVSFSTPNSLVHSARQTNLPSIAPKGLSFLSFGKSSVEDSAKSKETEPFEQRSSDALGICASSNIVAGTDRRTNSDGSGTGGPLNQGISSRSVNVCQIKRNLAPISPKEIDLPSSSGPSCVSYGGKSQATMLTNEHTYPQIREKGTANETDKLKAVIRSDSPISLGHSSLKIGGARSIQSSAQRALLSTLAIAETFESGMKMTSVAPSKDLNKDGKTSSDSKCNHNEELKPSAILDFLYSGGSKER